MSGGVWSTLDHELVYSSYREHPFTAQTTTRQWILFITASMDDYAERKRREQNLIVHDSTSEAEVTNNIEDCAPVLLDICAMQEICQYLEHCPWWLVCYIYGWEPTRLFALQNIAVEPLYQRQLYLALFLDTGIYLLCKHWWELK